MPNTVCQPFDYEHLLVRSLSDLLQTDAAYAFSKKQLKYLRPLLDVVLNKKMAQDPKVRPCLEKVLHQHLKNPAGLTQLKWETLCYEMVTRHDLALVEIWVDARPNGWDILATAPKSSNHNLKNIVTSLIPHLINSDQHQKLFTLIKSWSTDEREVMAEVCSPLHNNSEFMVDILAVLGNAPPQTKVEGLRVSEEIVEVFPEYFSAQIERGLNDFARGKDVLNTLVNFLPAHALSFIDPQKNEGVKRAFQYFEVLPEDVQNTMLEKIKSLSYAQDLWDASPEFKAFVEKKAIQEALENTPPSKNRRAKI